MIYWTTLQNQWVSPNRPNLAHLFFEKWCFLVFDLIAVQHRSILFWFLNSVNVYCNLIFILHNARRKGYIFSVLPLSHILFSLIWDVPAVSYIQDMGNWISTVRKVKHGTCHWLKPTFASKIMVAPNYI